MEVTRGMTGMCGANDCTTDVNDAAVTAIHARIELDENFIAIFNIYIYITIR
jgi:hypothetical protein